jgi:hypothetical protein
LDSRPVKIVTLNFAHTKDNVVRARYHVDLARGGHVVRYLHYTNDGAIVGKTDIKLSAFQVDGKEVWMPTSAETLGFSAINYKTKRPYFTKKPTGHSKIAVVDGTMEFNTHPGREIFTIDAKLGNPVSEQLRKMTAEFAAQKPIVQPTKAESETMLQEALTSAETEKRELTADPSSEGINWARWLPLVGVLAVGTSLFALWRQRRRS